MIPGEIETAAGDIEINVGRRTLKVKVANSGDRPIQVGSHYHFFETNAALRVRARQDARLSPEYCRPAPRCASSRGRRARSSWSSTPARAWCTDSMRGSWARWSNADGEDHAHGLCRDVRPDHRRPGAARRHRALDRGRGRSHDLRRRGEIRRRQGDPRRHGPEPARRARRGRHRHHQRADPRPLGHRQGRHRHQGRAHRRHRQGRQSRRAAGRRHRHRPRHRGRSPARA